MSVVRTFHIDYHVVPREFDVELSRSVRLLFGSSVVG